ncbi:TRAP transporter large permease [Nesterenkonia muleiensis]|uniref:TRAP transporter large permease n=1 Tax=Nesterenkonia muleiensis TaxID=2282648 RepID=UPI000E7353A3|nr:TRAP transporter large permease [Nesterenkonia muleiensis]
MSTAQVLTSTKASSQRPWNSTLIRGILYGTAGLSAAAMFLDLPLPAVGGLAACLMIALLFMNVPIGVAMGTAGALALLAMRGADVMAGSFRSLPFGTAAVWSYTVVPMFIFMGLLLWRSGITARIYDAAAKWLSWLPGGLAIGTNFAGGGMASISGSTVATVVSLGRIGLPEMLKMNYHPRLAAGSILVAGTGGQLIPPSIYLVIFAGLVSVPVGPQLLAGLVPGLLLLVLYGAVIAAVVMAVPSLVGHVRGSRTGRVQYSWGQRLRSLTGVWPLPLLVIFIFGGMYAGYFTTTEAGAIGALGAVVLTFTYLRPRAATVALGKSLQGTVGSTAAIFFLFIGAMIFNRALTVSGAANVVTTFIDSLGLTAVTFLLVLMVMYFLLGMIVDPLTMMLITVPLLLPSVDMLGINLIFFGVFVVAMGELAVITPPTGMMAFIVHKIAQDPEVNLGKKVTLGDVFIGAVWFLPVPLAMLVLLIFVPEIALWIPEMMQNRD